MKWQPKSIRETAYPLLILNWLTGLGLNDYPVGNRRNKLFLIAVIIIIGIFLLNSIYFQILECYGPGKSIFLLRKIMFYIEIITTITAVLQGWLYRKKMYQLTENMKTLDDTFECLGFKQNYHKNFKRLLYWIITYLILFFFTHVFHLYLWVLRYTTGNYFYLCTFIINWPYYTNTVVDLSFNFTLKFIERKLKILNIMLVKYFSKNPERSFFDDYVNRRLFISNSTNDLISEMSIKRNEQYLEIIKHIHLALYNLTPDINEIYGKHLLLQMILSFFYFTIWCFGLVLYSNHRLYLAVIFLIVRITANTMRLLHVVVPCCVINKENKKMKETLSEMKNMRKNLLLNEEIEHFYQQICLLPFQFTTCKFNTFGNEFLFQFFGSVLSYVFILVQFNIKLN